MLVYCNGDSFTAGISLYDYVLPKYLGPMNKKQISNSSKNIKYFQKVKDTYDCKYVDYKSIKTINNTNLEFFDDKCLGAVQYSNVKHILEKQLAYPAQLEKVDRTIKTINAAIAGASITGIIYRTIIDLLDFKAAGQKIHRVVIQLTSASRGEFFSSIGQNLMTDRPLTHFNDPDHRRISKLVTITHTDEDFMIKYLYTVSMLKEVCLSITGKLPVIIDSYNGTFFDPVIKRLDDEIKNNNSGEYNHFNKLLEHSMYNIWNNNFMKNIANTVKRPLEHDEHYALTVHKKAAAELVELL
tara:strand:+ start:876 stop:1769 length:894 start_codon:yes stop_codon:yes gene_type:complete